MVLQNSHVPLEEETDEDRIARKERIKTGCITAVKFIAIRLALIIVMIIYAVAGGYIFMNLESDNEKDGCFSKMNAYEPIENSTIEKLFKISKSFKSPGDVKFALDAYAIQLQEFNDNVLSIGYNGANCSILGMIGGPNYSWSFFGSLLFSATIFTTIGYGNIAPKTTWGRLVSIAYALIGIPLMLLVLASIGEIMANVFRYTYMNICCCGFLKKAPPPKPSSDKKEISGQNWNQASQNNSNVVDDDEDDEDDDDDNLDKISVPVTVSLLLVGSYVFVGALLFGVWNGLDWMDGSYFCFITIATVGFGDIVPGTDKVNEFSGQLQMIVTSVYMVCGMAILSMAFNLMQEEIIDKIEWLRTVCKKKKSEETTELINQKNP